jgi:hypothetical protein
MLERLDDSAALPLRTDVLGPDTRLRFTVVILNRPFAICAAHKDAWVLYFLPAIARQHSHTLFQQNLTRPFIRSMRDAFC